VLRVGSWSVGNTLGSDTLEWNKLTSHWSQQQGGPDGGRVETWTVAKPLGFLAEFMRMNPELLFVVFAGAVVVAFFLFNTLPRHSISRDWPPVYGRTFSILFSALFVGYGLYGLLTNDIWLPRTLAVENWPPGTRDVHMHGWCVWSFFLAAVCTAFFFTSAMGRRIPDYRLQVFRRVMFVSAWLFFILSLMGWLYGKIKG
jgi:hypothetical protein